MSTSQIGKHATANSQAEKENNTEKACDSVLGQGKPGTKKGNSYKFQNLLQAAAASQNLLHRRQNPDDERSNNVARLRELESANELKREYSRTPNQNFLQVPTGLSQINSDKKSTQQLFVEKLNIS